MDSLMRWVAGPTAVFLAFGRFPRVNLKCHVMRSAELSELSKSMSVSGSIGLTRW
jgi:hypothetical protein